MIKNPLSVGESSLTSSGFVQMKYMFVNRNSLNIIYIPMYYKNLTRIKANFSTGSGFVNMTLFLFSNIFNSEEC